MTSITSQTIIIIGAHGVGKSFLGNKILGKEEFPVRKGLATKTTRLKSANGLTHSQSISVIDTVGMAQSRNWTFEDITITQPKYFLETFARPQNLILYCIPGTDARLNYSDISNLLILQKLFGKEILSHVCIVITNLDALNESDRVRKMAVWRGEEVVKLLSRHGIHNITRDRVLHPDSDDSEQTLIQPLGLLLAKTTSFKPRVNEDLSKSDMSLLEAIQNRFVQAFLDVVREELSDEYEVERQHKKDNVRVIEQKMAILEFLLSPSVHRNCLTQKILEKRGYPTQFLQNLRDYFEMDGPKSTKITTLKDNLSSLPFYELITINLKDDNPNSLMDSTILSHSRGSILKSLNAIFEDNTYKDKTLFENDVNRAPDLLSFLQLQSKSQWSTFVTNSGTSIIAGTSIYILVTNWPALSIPEHIGLSSAILGLGGVVFYKVSQLIKQKYYHVCDLFRRSKLSDEIVLHLLAQYYDYNHS